MKIPRQAKQLFFLKYLFSKHSLNMLVWIMMVIVLPLFLYNYATEEDDIYYLIESKHIEYEGNGDIKYKFNTTNMDSEKETIGVSKKNYNLCDVNNNYETTTPTTLATFLIVFTFFWFLIFSVSSFKL